MPYNNSVRDPFMSKLRHGLCAALVILGVGCAADKAVDPGSTNPLPVNPAPTTPPSTAGVTTITVSPSNAIIVMGSVRAFTAQAKDAAGNNVAVTLAWQTSKASVATVDATGKVTAVAEGTADITASNGSVKSSGVTVTVTDPAPWPVIGASSGALIRAAVQQGALSAEQGLVFRVFAAFGDSRLPKQYRGIPANTPDDPVLIEAADRFTTLSTAAQAQLAPFFVPPPYPGSWYEANIPTPTAAAGVAVVAAGARQSVSSSSLCVFPSWHRSIETTHFKIHYDAIGTSALDQLESVSATIAASEAEKIWDKETKTFGREPLTDANVTTECNGGDGKLDIFVVGISSDKGTTAKTVPYVMGACAITPSYILVYADGDAKAMRNRLAHEFFHVLELGSYKRATGNCFKEYYWLGEATGNWAMDLVYPLDQYEQPWAGRYMDSERLVPLDEAFQGDADQTNGYCDYVFLLYLARKYNDNVIKEIWDASESANNSVTAIVNALASHGGIKKIWPDFALALWNDFGANNQNDFNKWDTLEWGMKRDFDANDAAGTFGNVSLRVDQKGAPRQSFELLSTTTTNAGGHELPRLTAHVDYLKFTDANVASVLYTNGLALADFPNLKIQAMVKIAGTWKPAEDWTKQSFKSFCRDLKAERVEELVLIYSNSDGDKAGKPIPFPFLPRLSVSNVGCSRWEGTSSVKTVVSGAAGGTSVVNATNVVFERQRFPQVPDGSPGMEYFTNLSAQITASASGPVSSSSAAGPAAASDANLQINLDNLVIGTISPPPDRNILRGSGASTLLTTTTIASITNTGPSSWSWMTIPVPGYSVSADGRTIEGNVVVNSPIGTNTITWKLTAVRDP